MQAIWERLNLTDEGDDNFIQKQDVTKTSRILHKTCWREQLRDTRKSVLEYDEVMREQREIIYSQRLQIINEDQSLGKVGQKVWFVVIIHRVVEIHIDRSKRLNLEGIVDLLTTQSVLQMSFQLAI